MIKSFKSVPTITFKEWNETCTCKCGGPIFKYFHTGKNIYIIKCGYVKETFEIESKTTKKKWIWSKNKKQPCNFIGAVHGEVGKFPEPKQKTNTLKSMENPHKILYEQLKSLFSFVLIEPRESKIQEINLLVKNKLHRKPRKIYYYPTIGPFMRESHKESLQEYHDRIFSREIIDKSIIIIVNNVQLAELEEEIIESDSDIDSSSELEEGDSEDEIEEPENDINIDDDFEEIYDEDETENDGDYNID
jgi:hypothetical protein